MSDETNSLSFKWKSLNYMLWQTEISRHIKAWGRNNIIFKPLINTN